VVLLPVPYWLVVMMWPVFFWVKLATLQRKRGQRKRGREKGEKEGEKGDRFIFELSPFSAFFRPFFLFPPFFPDISTEDLLAHACESLASASIMSTDFATFVDGPQRNMLLGIQQVIMLADLAVNRASDNLDPQD
jgi:hypothetical protein